MIMSKAEVKSCVINEGNSFFLLHKRNDVTITFKKISPNNTYFGFSYLFLLYFWIWGWIWKTFVINYIFFNSIFSIFISLFLHFHEINAVLWEIILWNLLILVMRWSAAGSGRDGSRIWIGFSVPPATPTRSG